MNYYDGTKLLSLLDINNEKPEIYLCTTNRTGGKTTYFSRLCVNKFIENDSKFMILYRFNYELDDCADKFFKDIKTLFFPKYEMTSERKSKGIYHNLLLNGKHCGYAVSINSADQIKRMSHLFSDCDRIFFDEFQSETNHYCDNEVNKFRGIHTSVARGQNKQVRYVPVYMCANPVNLLNPYYVALEVSTRLRNDTRFLKGNGFVIEQGFVESASKAQMQSGFNKAFGSDKFNAYQGQGVYLNDNSAFVEKMNGNSRYLCTLKYMGKEYGIREFYEEGIIYCDNHPDLTFPSKISVTTDDHQINYVMLKRNDFYLQNLRFYFEKGCFRFKDINCKDALMKALSY